MKAKAIHEQIFVLHADIQTDDLFEGIWPIPHGVSLNSYIVKGDSVALIDLVRDWMDAPKAFAEELASIGMSFNDVKYLILNHLEPDHTGWLSEFMKDHPNIEIITTAKGAALVKSFYKIDAGVRSVKSGDTLDLGKGMLLQFEEAPNVHWPETMVTFEKTTGTLFSCDAFGSFGRLGERVFDDEFSTEEHAFFERESLRYYANIVSSFSTFVEKAIAKLSSLPIKVVAPSHGMIFRKNPAIIIERYAKYAAYMNGKAEKEICIIWGSMYGNTEKGLQAVIKGIEKAKVPYSIHRVPNEDVSFILTDAYKSKGLVLAMPTYEYKMFPPMAYVLSIFDRKHVWNKNVLRIGSFGWVGGAKKEYDAAAESLKWTNLESTEWAGRADEEMLTKLEAQGAELAKMVLES